MAKTTVPYHGGHPPNTKGTYMAGTKSAKSTATATAYIQLIFSAYDGKLYPWSIDSSSVDIAGHRGIGNSLRIFVTPDVESTLLQHLADPI